MEFESFVDSAKDINGVLRITIPAKISQYMGLKEGDNVRVMVKKVTCNGLNGTDNDKK